MNFFLFQRKGKVRTQKEIADREAKRDSKKCTRLDVVKKLFEPN